jgi:hypothetical protein
MNLPRKKRLGQTEGTTYSLTFPMTIRLTLSSINCRSGRTPGQLVEIARFSNADKSTDVMMVGHTDNAGSIDFNQFCHSTVRAPWPRR